MKRILSLVLTALCAVPAIALFSAFPVNAQSSLAKVCNKTAIYDNTTNGTTQLISSGNAVYICGYTMFSGGTVSVSLVSGTGTNCANSQTSVTPAYQFVAQTGVVDESPFFRGMFVSASRAVCIKTNAGVAVQAIIYFAQ